MIGNVVKKLKWIHKKLNINKILRTQINLTYNNAKNIIKKHKINTKQQYYDLIKTNNVLPENPEIFFNNFVDWFDYLNLNKNNYYNKNICIKKIKEYNIKFIDVIQYCNELSKLDDKFPPNDLWNACYDTNNLKNELFKIKK